MNKDPMQGRIEEAKRNVDEVAARYERGSDMGNFTDRSLPLPGMTRGCLTTIGSIKAYSNLVDNPMQNTDRIVARPRTERAPAHWLFKTSEGLMGPFDSHEMAKAVLENYVARCKAHVITEATERS